MKRAGTNRQLLLPDADGSVHQGNRKSPAVADSVATGGHSENSPTKHRGPVPDPEKITLNLTNGHGLGLYGGIRDNVSFIGDHHIIYPLGLNIAIVNIKTGEMGFIYLPRNARRILSMSVAPNQRVFAVCESTSLSSQAFGEVSQVSVYHIGMKKRMRTINVKARGEFIACCFSGDSKYLITHSEAPDNNIIYWKWETEKAVASQVGAGRVTRVSTHPYNHAIAITSGPKHLQMWKLATDYSLTHKPILSLKKEASEIFTDHIWTHDKHLIVATEYGRVLVFAMNEANTALEQRQVIECVKSPIRLEVLVKYGKGFVVGGTHGYLGIYEALEDDDEDEKRFLQVKAFKPANSPAKNMYTSLALQPNMEKLLACTRTQQLVQFPLAKIDMLSESMDYFVPLVPGGNCNGSIVALDTCTFRPLVILVGSDKVVRAFNYLTWEAEMSCQLSEDPQAMACHPSGHFCIIALRERLRVYNIYMDGLVKFREIGLKNVKDVKFSHGGQYFACASGITVYLYDTYAMKLVTALDGHIGTVRKLQFSANDRALVSCGMDGCVNAWLLDGTFRRYDPLCTSMDSCQLQELVIDSDLTRALVSGSDGKLHEIMNGEVIGTFSAKSSSKRQPDSRQSHQSDSDRETTSHFPEGSPVNQLSLESNQPTTTAITSSTTSPETSTPVGLNTLTSVGSNGPGTGEVASRTGPPMLTRGASVVRLHASSKLTPQTSNASPNCADGQNDDLQGGGGWDSHTVRSGGLTSEFGGSLTLGSVEDDDGQVPVSITCLTLDSSNRMLVAGTSTGTVRAYRWPLSKFGEDYFQEYNAHAGPVNHVRFSPSDNRVVSGGSDGSTFIMDASWLKKGKTIVEEVDIVIKDRVFNHDAVLLSKKEVEDMSERIGQSEKVIEELKSETEYMLHTKDSEWEDRIRRIRADHETMLSTEKDAYAELQAKVDKAQRAHFEEMEKKEASLTKARQEIENEFERKIAIELERYDKVSEETELMRQRCNSLLDQQEDQSKRVLEEVKAHFEEQLSDLSNQVRSLQGDLKFNEQKFEEELKQQEQEYELEILRLKKDNKRDLENERQISAVKQSQLTQQRNRNVTLKNKMAEMKVIKAEDDARIKELDKTCTHLQDTLSLYEKNLEEREVALTNKEKTILTLRSSNRTLDNFRYVLDHRIEKLTAEKGPIQDHIKKLESHIRAMYDEMVAEFQAKKMVDRQMAQKDTRMESLQGEVRKLRAQNREKETKISTLLLDISNVAKILDMKQMQTRLKQMYTTHVLVEDRKLRESDTRGGPTKTMHSGHKKKRNGGSGGNGGGGSGDHVAGSSNTNSLGSGGNTTGANNTNNDGTGQGGCNPNNLDQCGDETRDKNGLNDESRIEADSSKRPMTTGNVRQNGQLWKKLLANSKEYEQTWKIPQSSKLNGAVGGKQAQAAPDVLYSLQESIRQRDYMEKTIYTLKRTLGIAERKLKDKTKRSMHENSILINECNSLRRETVLQKQRIQELEDKIASQDRQLSKSTMDGGLLMDISSPHSTRMPSVALANSLESSTSGRDVQPQDCSSSTSIVESTKSTSRSNNDHHEGTIRDPRKQQQQPQCRPHTTAGSSRSQHSDTSAQFRFRKKEGPRRKSGLFLKRPSTSHGGSRSSESGSDISRLDAHQMAKMKQQNDLIKMLTHQLDVNNREVVLQRNEISRLRDQIQILASQSNLVTPAPRLELALLQ